VKPEKRSISRSVAQPGYIQAFEQTPIFALIPGYVQKWSVDIGDVVHKGDVLAELWVPEQVSLLNLKREQVQQAKKAMVLARTQVETAAAQLKEAEAALGRARALNDYWKGQSERFDKLVTQNVLDKQSHADALSQFQAAAAALAEAQARISSASKLVHEKETAREKAEIDIKAAEADKQHQADIVRYATFLAPYDGVVTRRNVNTFDFVQPPTAGKGDPLYVIERRDIMRIFVEVPESDAVWVTKGTLAHIRIPALQGREFSGTVARTSYALHRATRTLLAEIDLDNDKDELRPGMYSYAKLESQGREVMTLPASAILTEGDVNVGYRTFCYRVVNGHVQRTQVEIGTRNERLVEVLKMRIAEVNGKEARWEGITGAETIVQSDLSGLQEGQAVNVMPKP
jgi:RND family efflux transporter MFP subunit